MRQLLDDIVALAREHPFLIGVGALCLAALIGLGVYVVIE